KAAPKTVWISHEAGDVLKLVRAKVNDDVVMAFIENSRTGFNLSADEIVQLHNEGVSDRMIQAMLARRKAAPQPTISAPQQEVAVAPPTVVQQPTTVVTQPTTTYVQSEPTYVYQDPYYYSSYYPY